MTRRALVIMASILIDTIISVIEAFIIMLLWNWLVVSIFSAPAISFWVAFGILCVLNLIGSFFRSGN
jgi:hypothetical protein